MINLINRTLKQIKFCLLIACYILLRRNKKFKDDLNQAINICHWHKGSSNFKSYINFICFLPEFREIAKYRLGSFGKILGVVYPNKILLRIGCSEIEGGFYLHHAHSTQINASAIGKDCQIWQNVTIGVKYTGGGRPLIGNKVLISAGACVLGEIKIGDNVIIGANAVVTKDIPNNCIVGGVPAKIIKMI